MWPTIVAESLAPVVEPLATALQPGPLALPCEVAAALAASLEPPAAGPAPPAWLWPSQHTALRRVLAAIARYGGALLAEPVGTGKTYVALAAARAVNGSRGTVCLAPAALREQWRAVAAQVGVEISVWSHERASRGALPPHQGRLVIIDESHRLRNPGTRLYEQVAPWLLRHQTLMLSATPVVNRLSDLAWQLRLAIRDDALAAHGVRSLAVLLDGGSGHPALGLVVVSGQAAAKERPRAADRVERTVAGPDDAGLLDAIDRLALSTDLPVAALLRSLLWRAAGSSPAALAASLRRYRSLLRHAQDAELGGQGLSRRALVQLSGGLGEQLMMWELLPLAHGTADLVASDLPLLDQLIAQASTATLTDDAKLTRLRAILADGQPTLVFSVSRETVRWLRDRLGHRVAWCTGQRAGIGAGLVSRRAVFAWFDAGAPARRERSHEGRFAPTHLVCTDVAAEGLDLQGAARVVHYDLPWTPMRLDQRRGRVLRAGSRYPEVEIVRLDPPIEVERRLRMAELLRRKAGLPALVGVGEEGGSWHWRAEVARRFRDVGAAQGVAAVLAEPAGMLAGFSLHPWPDPGGPPSAAHALWWEPGLGWSEEPELVMRRLDQCPYAEAAPVAMADARAALRLLGGAVRERIRAIRRAAWEPPIPAPAARRLLARLGRLASQAARRRDAAALGMIQRAMAFAGGGHTIGEDREVERLSGLRDPDLLAALPALPPTPPPPAVVQARVTGVILFYAGATFPRWPGSALSCSTWTAR